MEETEGSAGELTAPVPSCSSIAHKVVRDAGWLASTHSRSFPMTLELQGANWQAVCAKPGLGVINNCKLMREEPNVVQG